MLVTVCVGRKDATERGSGPYLALQLTLSWTGRIGRSHRPHRIQQQRPAVKLCPENPAVHEEWLQAGKNMSTSLQPIPSLATGFHLLVQVCFLHSVVV